MGFLKAVAVITGALIQTAVAAPRIALNDPDYPNELIMESGQANETAPGRLLSQVPSGLQAQSHLRSPQLDGGSTAGLALTADAAALGGLTHAQIDGHEILLNTFGAGAAVEVRNTEIELNRPVLNADLRSATNLFPSLPYSVAYSGTTDANGFLTVTHGAPFTPVGGWAVTTNPGASFALFWGIDTIGATTVRLRFANAGGDGPLVSLAATGRLFLVRP